MRAAAEELKRRRTARRDLIPFISYTHPGYNVNWHHQLTAKYLMEIARGQTENNLMVFEPPRHGKSEQITVRWPAWTLGEQPHEHFIATAYGDKLATTFSRACRNVIDSPQYQRLWPHKFKRKGDTAWELSREKDDQRSTYIAAGILSALTGEGATKLIVDDPVKNAEEAYSSVIREKIWSNFLTAANTRLAPNGKKILVMTRWHEDDLAGRLLARALEDRKADQWTVIVLAAHNDNGEDSYIWNTRTGEKTFIKKYEALWPEAYPRPELDRLKATLGSVFWSALYMQRPTQAQGGIFKRENWNYHDQRPPADFLIQIYDGACEQGQENDYSASETMASGPGGFHIYDAWRDKVTFPYLMAKVYERWAECLKQYGRYPDRLVVENKSSGVQIGQQLDTNNISGIWTFPDGKTRRVPVIPITRVPAQQSKMLRAQGISGYHESKTISLPRGADWVGDFVDEHALFDKGPHDDWVDCTVHGVTFFTRPTEDQEQLVIHGEEITISSDLDEFEVSSW